MTFKESQPIFVQIAERLCDEILAGRYAEEERVPGVRDYAALLEVNANTVVKSYDNLTRRDVIYTKRGLGYFVCPDARRRIIEERRTEFMERTLPKVFARMRQLNLTPADLQRAWEEQKMKE